MCEMPSRNLSAIMSLTNLGLLIAALSISPATTALGSLRHNLEQIQARRDDARSHDDD